MNSCETERPISSQAETAYRLLSIQQLSNELLAGKTAIYTLVKRGELPRPIKVGGSSRWLRCEVQAALDVLKARGARAEGDGVPRRGRPHKTVGGEANMD